MRPSSKPALASPLTALAWLAGLGVLGLHAWSYRFLTDDAFISFRYARNLATGHGLVFNPGFERVEGYSNALWVLVLAAFARLGVAPEIAATALSLAATAVLWLTVAWFGQRLAAGGRQRWAALTAPLALALDRSFAVWSTSGLETRAFELLLVAAALRWIVELEAWHAGAPRRSVAPWMFALACWTRPDGLLPAVAAFAAGCLWLAGAQRLAPRVTAAWLPFAGLVAAQFLLRRAYYGDWLPNTYYAKVGGTLWWSAGGTYLAAFALEYALWLWVPLALVGAAALARRGRGLVPLLFGALVLPYGLYVTAVGGDYFEYRLLDLVFPFLFLLAGEGVRTMAMGRAGRWVAAPVLAAALGLAWDLPWQSRRQFPGADAVGFPGRMLEQSREARAYLDPALSPIHRRLGLSWIAEAHRQRLRWLTRHFIGLRQEEHALFTTAVVDEGRRLRRLMDRGWLPRDLHVAMGAVGAVPYYTDLRVLDMQGLTDAQVARSGPSRVASERLMAHDRSLDWDQAVARGVDLVMVDAHPLLAGTSDAMLSRVREASTYPDSTWAAEVEDGAYLVALLPQGPAATARRLPRLRFQRLADPRFVQSFLDQTIAAWSDTLSARPQHHHARLRLAWLLLARQDYEAARAQYREAIARGADPLESWDGLAWCEARLGNLAGARAALERAIFAANAEGARSRLPELESRLAALGAARR